MSDEGTARPFSPAELDAIEDALEQLQGEHAFVVGELPDGGDALVRERLTSYRAITRLSRDVLSQYAAPSHVLDRVMTLARQSAVDPPPFAPVVAPLEAPAQRSWWARLRGTWAIPMVAAAAAVALVVVIAVPMSRDAERPAADTVAVRSPSPTSAAEPRLEPPAATPSTASADRLASADEPADGEEQGALRGAAALEESKIEGELERGGKRFYDDDRAQAERRKSASTTTDPAVRDDKPSPTPKAPSAKSGAERREAQPNKPAPESTSAPAEVPADAAKPGGGGAPGTTVPPKNDAKTKGKDAETTTKVDTENLARADLARRGGDCAAAVPLYESVRKSGTRKQRARALVGLALCAETSGESDRATALFAQARAEDSEIDAYVESER